jgi:hypothetical protein
VRITVTVVDLSNAWSADVLADPELPVSALAQHLTGHAPDSVVPLSRGSARRDERGPGGPTFALHDRAPVLYLGGKAPDPAATLQDSGLLEGAVVSLDDPGRGRRATDRHPSGRGTGAPDGHRRAGAVRLR